MWKLEVLEDGNRTVDSRINSLYSKVPSERQKSIRVSPSYASLQRARVVSSIVTHLLHLAGDRSVSGREL